MHRAAILVVIAACTKDEPPPPQPVAASGVSGVSVDAAPDAPDAPALPAHRAFDDLAGALAAAIPADARVVGFGELHARADRPGVRTSMSAFTDALPTFGERFSDMILETWIVDKKCGSAAATTTKKLEKAVSRPESVKTELDKLVDATRAAKIKPHAMTVTCADYKKMDHGGEPDPIFMLGLTTRELTRIAREAVTVRDKQKDHRPLIALYGGALHNDRFPGTGTEEWSYAADVDKVSNNHFIEVDIVAPELAEADRASRATPWFPLCAGAKKTLLYQRGEQSFVVILPRSTK